MKLELNFLEDRDGNTKVVISSPTVKTGIITDIGSENYDYAQKVLSCPKISEENIKGLIEAIAAELDKRDPREDLKVSVWRHCLDNGTKHYGMMAWTENGGGRIHEYSTTDITNREYRNFCKGDALKKIRTACHAFERLDTDEIIVK